MIISPWWGAGCGDLHSKVIIVKVSYTAEFPDAPCDPCTLFASVLVGQSRENTWWGNSALQVVY